MIVSGTYAYAQRYDDDRIAPRGQSSPQQIQGDAMTTTDRNESAIQELLDKEAIRDALVRYCRGVDRGDADLICSAYHPDAEDDHGFSRFTGETVGPVLVERLRIRSPRVYMHHITNQLIELQSPDRAASETYFTVWISMEREGTHNVLHRSADIWTGSNAATGSGRSAPPRDHRAHAGLAARRRGAGVTPGKSRSRGPRDPSYEILRRR